MYIVILGIFDSFPSSSHQMGNSKSIVRDKDHPGKVTKAELDRLRINPAEINKIILNKYNNNLEYLLDFCNEIMDFYARKRTKNGKGITIQSQIRFLRLYTLYLFNKFSLQPYWDIRHEAKIDANHTSQKEISTLRRKTSSESKQLEKFGSHLQVPGVDEEEEEKKLIDDSHNEISYSSRYADSQENQKVKIEDPPYNFHKAVFSKLEMYSLEDIVKTSKNLPLLAPLKINNRLQEDFSGIKIKLYKITCVGYKNPKSIKVKLVHEKSYNLNATAVPKDSKKKRHGYHNPEEVDDEEHVEEDASSWTFGASGNSSTFVPKNNPDLGGDFEVNIQIGKQKLSAWFNVPFLIQIAHLIEKCDKSDAEENCLGDHFVKPISTALQNTRSTRKSLKENKNTTRNSKYESKTVTSTNVCPNCWINYCHYTPLPLYTQDLYLITSPLYPLLYISTTLLLPF